MFCRNCGTKIDHVLNFCPQCGTRIDVTQSENNFTAEEDDIKFRLKPKFHALYKIVNNFYGLISYILFLCFLAKIIQWWEFLGGICIYSLIKLIFSKKQYDHLEYNFYNTKMEYSDNFLNREEKVIEYKYVREIEISQTFLERLFRIGTIIIFTNASSNYQNYERNHSSMKGRNGIYIHCVDNIYEQYKKIKQIIDENR